MKILMQIPAQSPEETEEQFCERLFDSIQTHYVKTTGGAPDAPRLKILEPYADNMQPIFGSKHPNEIVNAAKTWNRRIEQEFTQAMLGLIAETGPEDNLDRHWLGAGAPAIYRMKCAATALDSAFYPFAEQMLFLSNSQFTAVLQPDERNAILAHPERFALINVYPE